MKKIILIAMGVLCLTVTTLFSAVYADTSVNENLNYKLVNQNNHKALAVFSGQNVESLNYDYVTGSGEIKLLDENNLDTQQFYFVKAGERDYYLMSRAGDTMYLVTALSAERVEAGNKVVIRDAFIDNKAFQKWQLVGQGDSSYSLISAADPSLAISFVGYENIVRLMPYTGDDTQQFSFKTEQKSNTSRSDSINRPVKLARVGDDMTSETDTEGDNIEAAEQSQFVPEQMNNWFKLMDNEYASVNRGIDFDGYYGAQCVDLAFHYTHYLFHPNENFGAFRKSIYNGNGGEIYNTGNSEYYEKIKYFPGFVAQKGDIVVFQYNPARGWGHWGHVAVVESATSDQLNVITQNGSRGHYVKYSTYEYSTYAAYNYTEIVGFLRPKLDKIAQN